MLSFRRVIEVVKKEINISKKIVPVKTKTAVKIKPIIKKNISTEIVKPKDVLYAQALKNGFQLVNTKPEVVFQILKTNNQDLFIMKDKNGILYKNGDVYRAEYYQNDILIIKEYLIKF